MTQYRHHAYDLWIRRQRRQARFRVAGRLFSAAKTAVIITTGLILVALGQSMR